MPWCEDCSKFWTPTSLPPDGTCPTCGAIIGDPPSTRVPWHFWVLVVALSIYLGWRLIQGFEWLVANDRAFLMVPLGLAVAALVLWLTWGFWRRRESDADDVVAYNIVEPHGDDIDGKNHSG